MRLLRRFRFCPSGATAIEYGLLASLIAGALVFSLALLGDSVSGAFNGVSSVLPDGGQSQAVGGTPPNGGKGNGKGNNGNGQGNGGPRTGP